MTIDPKKLTIGDLAKEISKIEDSEELNNILVAENVNRASKNILVSTIKNLMKIENSILKPTIKKTKSVLKNIRLNIEKKIGKK